MLYIITFALAKPRVVIFRARRLHGVHGDASSAAGCIAVFSCIFLFYTNAFLIRRRKNRNLGFIIFSAWKSATSA